MMGPSTARFVPSLASMTLLLAISVGASPASALDPQAPLTRTLLLAGGRWSIRAPAGMTWSPPLHPGHRLSSEDGVFVLAFRETHRLVNDTSAGHAGLGDEVCGRRSRPHVQREPDASQTPVWAVRCGGPRPLTRTFGAPSFQVDVSWFLAHRDGRVLEVAGQGLETLQLPLYRRMLATLAPRTPAKGSPVQEAFLPVEVPKGFGLWAGWPTTALVEVAPWGRERAELWDVSAMATTAPPTAESWVVDERRRWVASRWEEPRGHRALLQLERVCPESTSAVRLRMEAPTREGLDGLAAIVRTFPEEHDGCVVTALAPPGEGALPWLAWLVGGAIALGTLGWWLVRRARAARR